jgi:hypothetical protein
MRRFKHKIEYFVEQSELESALMEYGQEGWELINIVPVPNAEEFGRGHVLLALFKQEYES